MRKIFLVTRRAGYNFGSSLQAFALQQIFRLKGFDCEILNVKEIRQRGKIRLCILNCIGRIFYLMPNIKKLIGPIVYNRFIQSYRARKKFDYFNSNVLTVSKPLRNTKALKLYIKERNIVICGSDQIWNPFAFNPIMALSFVNPLKNILVAYAPSFGVSEIPLKSKDMMAHYLSRFHYLSIREKSGAEIINNLIGKEVPILLDPTLVVDKSVWNTIEKPVSLPYDKYILCYFLKTNNVPRKYIAELAAEKKAIILNIQTNYSILNIEGAENRADFGPENFIFLIKNATCIVTNSYHCCIFSHIYEKDFRVFSRFSSIDKMNQNSRIEMLLTILKERHRWIDRENYFMTENEIATVEDLKLDSLQYIENIIKL